MKQALKLSDALLTLPVVSSVVLYNGNHLLIASNIAKYWVCEVGCIDLPRCPLLVLALNQVGGLIYNENAF